MDYIIHSIIGLFFIGLGFLVKSFPGLISGYNTMSKDMKKNVDIEGLSTCIRNGSIAIGLSIIVGYFLFKWIGLITIADLLMPIVILIGSLIMVIYARRFDHNKNRGKRTIVTVFILGFVIVIVAGLLTYGSIPSKAILNNDSIRFTGFYGFEMSVSDIGNIELIENIPPIRLRTNGFSFGTVNKGFFKLKKFGRTRLLIDSSKPPFLLISRSKGNKIIVNFRDKKETERMFDEINSLIRD